MENNTVEIWLKVVHQTKLAYLTNDGGTLNWLPKSQVEILDSAEGEEYLMSVPEWLALDNGLI